MAQVGPHAGDLPQRLSLLSVTPPNAVVSALKQSEDGKALVLRMFNPTGKKVGAEIKTRARIRAAHLLTLEELPVKKLAALGKSVKVSLAPKKIVTLKLDMDSV